MVRLDLHVHSLYSVDAKLRPEDIIKEALKRGLDGVAVTDHGTAKGGLAVKRLSPPGFIAIPGVEARTSRGELLILFIEEEVRSQDPLEVIDEAKEAGGLVVLPHPFDWVRGVGSEEVEELVERVDAVEVFNSRCPLMRMNIKAQQLAKSLNKPSTAGSDAHFSMEVGRAWTVVEADSAEGVREAILRGQTETGGKRSPLYVHLMSWLAKVGRRLAKHSIESPVGNPKHRRGD